MEDIMNRISRQIIVSLLAIFGFIYLMGIAGRYDYADEVVYTMSEEVYYTILDTLGDDCSNIAVADEYIKNKEYYDNLQHRLP